MRVIDIVLPVYNEEAGIELFHRELTAVLETLADRYTFRLIYVLDRSSDDTFGVLTRLARASDHVRIVHLARRFGHQASLMAGLDHASGDAVIMMDSDLQHPPRLIPEFLARFEAGYDVVQAVRRYGHDVGVVRRQLSALFYRLQNALSPVEIASGAADFRLVSRRVVRVFQEGLREQSPFLRGLFQWVGFNRTEVPFVSAERAAGVTKYRWRTLLTFSIVGIVSFSKVPLRLAALLGFGVSIMGIAYAVWLLWAYVVRGGFPPGFASLILVTLVIGGLQLMFLGILGEYVGSVFDEVKRRPLYIVDEIVGGEARDRR